MIRYIKHPNHRIILPSEMRLLLLCLDDPNLPIHRVKILRLLKEELVSWEVFYDITVKNKLTPLVYRALKKLPSDQVDQDTFDKLAKDYQFIQYYSLLLTSELLHIFNALKEQHISAISIKGPALSYTLYGDISMRLSRDLDILADPSKIRHIDRLLIKSGYTRDQKSSALTPKQEKQYVKTYAHYTYLNYNTGVQIELHWVLSNDYYDIPFINYRNRQEEISLLGQTLTVLKEEENLVYLIYHGSKHAWERLVWICDVYHMIKYKPLDWDYIIERAGSLGIMHMLGQTFLLLSLLFHYRPERELPLSPKNKRLARRLARLSLPFILSVHREADIDDRPLSGDYRKYRMYWNYGAGRKLRYFISLLVPKVEDFHSVRISDHCFFLYYIYHLISIPKIILSYGKDLRWPGEGKKEDCNEEI